jgi:hypothetical protein
MEPELNNAVNCNCYGVIKHYFEKMMMHFKRYENVDMNAFIGI